MNEVLACPLNLIRFPSIFAIELEQAELLLKEAKLALEARSLALIALYIASFISSLIFGPILGRLADQYGRKRLSLICCATFSVSCILKMSLKFFVLMTNSVVGGICNLLSFMHFKDVFEFFCVDDQLSCGRFFDVIAIVRF